MIVCDAKDGSILTGIELFHEASAQKILQKPKNDVYMVIHSQYVDQIQITFEAPQKYYDPVSKTTKLQKTLVISGVPTQQLETNPSVRSFVYTVNGRNDHIDYQMYGGVSDHFPNVNQEIIQPLIDDEIQDYYLSDLVQKVDSEITRYLNDIFSGGNSPKWSGNEHAMIINDSCWKWGVDSYYRSQATSSAPIPDSFWTFPYSLINHYWNPNPLLSWLGQGRYYCDYYADLGKSNLDLGYYLLAYQQMGYSSHFLTDLGNPLHTGKEAEQLFQGISPPWSPPLYSWVHNNYEGYVNAYWSTAPTSGPYAFSYFVTNNWYYYPMTDPFVSAQSLAQYSNTKLNTLYYYVYNNPYTLQNDPNTYMITSNVLIDASKHTLGLVKYVRD